MRREWLVQLRKSRSLTQEIVADYAHIDRAFYAQIETGTRDPSLPVAISLSTVLCIHPRLFYLNLLRQSPYDTGYGVELHTHCNLRLEYTWGYKEGTDTEELLRTLNLQNSSDTTLLHLAHLKHLTIDQEVSINATLYAQSESYIVRCMPMVSVMTKSVFGVYTVSSKIPSPASPTLLP